MNERVNNLFKILIDKSAREDERHDAAIALYDYDDPEIIEIFFSIGQDKKELHILLEAVGEGIVEIWHRNNQIDIDKLQTLAGTSYDVAVETLKNKT